MTGITRIRVTAAWHDAERGDMVAVADFTLGLGKCGKVVTHLTADMDGDWLAIGQTTEDGEVKAFLYHASTLRGRAEITY